MIRVTRFNGSKLYINAELIHMVEGTPDTVISLTTETKIVVKETPQAVVDRVIEYRRKILNQEIKVK